MRYHAIIRKREGISIYHIDELASDVPLTLFYKLGYERNSSNLFYYHARILKKFAGIDERYKLPYAIEHGPYLNNFVWDADLQSDTPGIITFSDYRYGVLSKVTDKPIVRIGPYIHYAYSFLTPEEIEKQKKKQGRTLLVLPSHSTHYHEVSFDYQKDVDFILETGKGFDTILVCLYWKDILDGKADYYRNNKFRLITAGHIFDPLFLPRLKSIIMLSDFTMSNSPGTHIGYCVDLGKPHYVYSMDKTINTSGGVVRHWENLSNEERGNSREMVLESFSKFQDFIDPEQRKVVEYIWGTNHIKTKEEMTYILKGKPLGW